MNAFRFLSTLVLSSILMLGHSSLFAQSVNDLQWLLGEWEYMEGETSTVEKWNVADDSTLVGNSVTERNGAAVFTESLRIEQRQSSFNYVAVLPNKTAIFTLESLAEGQVSFVDPENDFPSRIVYRKTGPSLEIVLEGSGQQQVMNFQARVSEP